RALDAVQAVIEIKGVEQVLARARVDLVGRAGSGALYVEAVEATAGRVGGMKTQCGQAAERCRGGAAVKGILGQAVVVLLARDAARVASQIIEAQGSVARADDIEGRQHGIESAQGAADRDHVAAAARLDLDRDTGGQAPDIERIAARSGLDDHGRSSGCAPGNGLGCETDERVVVDDRLAGRRVRAIVYDEPARAPRIRDSN